LTDFLQTLLDGIAVGSLYGLIALGYTMVYGILQFINFAHSDIFMLGAWFSYLIARTAGWTHAMPESMAGRIFVPLVVLLGAMFACGMLGFAIERLAYRPLRRAPRLNVLITAIGVSLFLENVGQLNGIFGTQPQRLPLLLPDAILFEVAGVQVHLVDVLVIALAVALMLVLDWLVFHTKLGTGMRAVSFDTRVASLMGVPVDAVISFTFVLGSTLAAAAGFLYANKYPGLNQPAHATWILLGLKAFVAAVVGGIGNVRGAMFGGLLIGLLEFFGAFYLSPNLKDVYVFSLLILVLLFRPTGLFGKRLVEKV
jgi:branched-chain amino acid transport system permease protein